MSNDDTDKHKTADGRRKGDRRSGQKPFDGPDRREGDRRSGEDRRTSKRF